MKLLFRWQERRHFEIRLSADLLRPLRQAYRLYFEYSRDYYISWSVYHRMLFFLLIQSTQISPVSHQSSILLSYITVRRNPPNAGGEEKCTSFEHQQAATAARMQKIGNDKRRMIPARVILHYLLLFNSFFRSIPCKPPPTSSAIAL